MASLKKINHICETLIRGISLDCNGVISCLLNIYNTHKLVCEDYSEIYVDAEEYLYIVLTVTEHMKGMEND